MISIILKKNTLVCLGCFFILLNLNAGADDSDIIKADRQALVDATATASSSKILAAKEQLSDDLQFQVDQKRRDAEGITIPLTPDAQGHLMANVLINNTTHASLIVDTGSPIVMLTNSFIQKLGLDISQANHGYVEILGGRYKAAAVSLNSIQVGEIQAQNIDATVLLQESPGIEDGLLGMSFLSKFHFTLDQTGQKLVLRKLENN